MQKIAINRRFGGFSLSEEAEKLYKKLEGIREDDDWYSQYDIERGDPSLIKVIEELGEHANGSSAKLKIVEIPDDVNWVIKD